MSGESARTVTDDPASGPDSPGRGPDIMAFAGLGMLNAVCLLAGIGLGYLIDDALGTLPAFMMVGLVAGIVVGVLATRDQLRRY